VAIGRISGALLFSDLDRQSVDLAFTTNGKPLTYMDFTNFRFGVNTNSVVDTFTVAGTANVSGITKIFGNLVAASQTASSNTTTGALVVLGGVGITGNLHAGNLFADNFSGNISNTGGTSIFGNIAVTDTAFFNSLNTANAVISGGYISALSNATIIDSNVSNLYATVLNSTAANLTLAYVANFNSGNAVISGGYISALSNAYITTATVTNLSSGNILISGGYIQNLANATITTGNTESWYATELNSSAANLYTAFVGNLSTANAVVTGGYIFGLANLQSTYSVFNNFSTGNAVISGGYISALSNATITTANITTANLGNLKIQDVVISSLTGNLVLAPLLSNSNAVVVINGTSALQLPSGTTGQQPAAYAGAIRWNNSTNAIEVYNGSIWVSLLGQINNQTIAPDGTNISYTLDYTTTAEGIIVSINGTLQQPGVAYTVAGTTITFAEIPLVTDIVSIRYIAAGTTTAENAQEINSANIALSTGAVLVDSFNVNVYRSVKYMASTTANSGDAEFAEFAVTQFDPNVAVSNVNRATTGSTLTTISANISGSVVQVYATASSSAQMRLQKTYFII
jgi:hypothetical protein